MAYDLSELRSKVEYEKNANYLSRFKTAVELPAADIAYEGLYAAEVLHREPIKKNAYAEFWLGGGLARVKRDRYTKPLSLLRGARRGIIKTFTFAARRRLMRIMSQLKRDALPVFVTLTYPSQFPHEPERYKRDLDVFMRRLARKFPAHAAVWRLEFQKRGAAHYHLLVWHVAYPELLEWVSAAWFQVVGSGDEKHLRAGTRVEAVRSWGGVLAYASKYLAKVIAEAISNVGRWWGVYGRERLPWADMVRVPLTDKQGIDLLRLFKKFAGIPNKRCNWTLAILCDARQWFDRLKLLAV